MSQERNVTVHVGLPPGDFDRMQPAIQKRFGVKVSRAEFVRWAVGRALDEILGPPPKNAKAGKKPAQVTK